MGLYQRVSPGWVLRLLARPVRRSRERGGLAIQPYRGYGTGSELFVMGRVFRQPGRRRYAAGFRRDLADIGRRIARRGIAGAEVTVSYGPARASVRCDRDGYFRCTLRPAQPLPRDRLWHRVSIHAALGERSVAASGFVFVPPEQARYVVISDIDDTVVHTGVAHKTGMLWRLFIQGAAARTAFPGVDAFYRALHDGASGIQSNPMLYVSRGPWGLYELLDEFFRLHDIPVGPILFLREWGISWRRPWPRRAPDHKLAVIRSMLQRYEALPFVLIGDSGQHDPEIYARAVAEWPGRVAAVYIRNVSRDRQREQAIEALAEQVSAAGSTLLLANDSGQMARHAAAHGLIPAAMVEAIAERSGESGGGLGVVRQRTPEETRQSLARGALDRALGEQQQPRNVLVEPANPKQKDR